MTFDPIPLTTFMIVLPFRRGVRKGAASVSDWLVSLAVVVAVTVLATGNNPPQAAHRWLIGKSIYLIVS